MLYLVTAKVPVKREIKLKNEYRPIHYWEAAAKYR